jgi:hypothetical protein
MTFPSGEIHVLQCKPNANIMGIIENVVPLLEIINVTNNHGWKTALRTIGSPISSKVE